MIDFFTCALFRIYRHSIFLVSTCAPLRDLCSLLSGGATIDTHNGDSIVLRTVIQVDGDVLTIVADSDGTEALWDAHAKSVVKLLARISDQLNGIARWLTFWVVGIGTFGVLALCWGPNASYSEWGLDDWLHLFIVNFSMPMGLTALAQAPVIRRAIVGALLRTIPWLALHDRRDRIEAVQAAGSV